MTEWTVAKTPGGVVHAFNAEHKVSLCRMIERSFCYPEVAVRVFAAFDMTTCPTCKERLP